MMQNIAVIGAGTMGNGIAHVFAQNGYKVQLIDIDENRLQSGISTITANLNRQLKKEVITPETLENTLNNITATPLIANGVAHAGLVVEAATENKKIKFDIFRQLDELAPENCILASNTSSISITEIAAVTKRPEKIIGMHFMNPVPVMKLVEIINGYATAADVTDTIVNMSRQLGKIPCVANDYPGFVANRILMPMINEAFYTYFEGVADAVAIDSIMKLGMAHPMGPLQLADFIGLDVCLAILKVLHDGFGNPKYAPCPLLVNMVNAGKLGIKTREGVYKYDVNGKIM